MPLSEGDNLTVFDVQDDQYILVDNNGNKYSIDRDSPGDADVKDDGISVFDLEAAWQRVLKGETIEVGIFQVYEDFKYTRIKDTDDTPLLNRVIALVYYDEDEGDGPSFEEFDGTLASFKVCLDAHQALDPELEHASVRGRDARQLQIQFYAVPVEGCVEPSLRGPYSSNEERFKVALEIRKKQDNEGDALFWLDIDSRGNPTIGSFSSGELGGDDDA